MFKRKIDAPLVQTNAQVLPFPQTQGKPWLGVCWKLLACICFALINICVRYLTTTTHMPTLSPPQLVFFQNLFGCLFISPFFLAHKNMTHQLRLGGSKILHTIRVLSAALGVLCLFVAMAHMPIPQAIALGFTGPVFTIVLSAVFLNEQLTAGRLGAIFFSLIGALFILRPDRAFYEAESDFNGYFILPILSAFFIAICKICSRKLLLKKASSVELAFHLMFWMTPVSFVLSWSTWQPIILDHFIYLVCLGGIATLAYYSGVKAFAYSEVTFLMPIGISKLIFSFILSFLIFQELPHQGNIWIGILAIAGSLILLQFWDHQRKTS